MQVLLKSSKNMHKGFLITAAVIGALSVAFGAFGAHSLRAILTDQALATYETAVRYQFYHVFALALTGILYKSYPNKLLKSAGRLFMGGILLFSGSLYLLTYASATGASFRWAGPITPLGGVLFILGWICLALGIRKGLS
jgi:uncharacterized membrane protein YgdD (TMEM256/DUF423 family)